MFFFQQVLMILNFEVRFCIKLVHHLLHLCLLSAENFLKKTSLCRNWPFLFLIVCLLFSKHNVVLCIKGLSRKVQIYLDNFDSVYYLLRLLYSSGIHGIFCKRSSLWWPKRYNSAPNIHKLTGARILSHLHFRATWSEVLLEFPCIGLFFSGFQLIHL